MGFQEAQQNLFEPEAARSLLDKLLTNSQLYRQSKDYKELLDFVIRLRNFSPFNAMLLQVQKPGLRYAASAYDWLERFNRTPKEGARPLLILWPFGPVALVYDVMDTEGEGLPSDVVAFPAEGDMNAARITTFIELTKKKGIDCCWIDAGDQMAGSISVVLRAANTKEFTQYRIQINRNHFAPVQFATLAHELGHLFLGHLGPDKKLNIPERATLGNPQRELEAESVAYLVCARNEVRSKSETYLTNYITTTTTIGDVDVYQVMRAAGQVEAILALAPRLLLKPVSAEQTEPSLSVEDVAATPARTAPRLNDGLIDEDIPADIEAMLNEEEERGRGFLPISSNTPADIPPTPAVNLKTTPAPIKNVLRPELSNVVLWIGVVALVALVIGPIPKHEIYVEPDGPTVLMKESKWWGLQESHFEIRWMKPAGFDDEAWCRQDKRGEWFPFFSETLDPPDPE